MGKAKLCGRRGTFLTRFSMRQKRRKRGESPGHRNEDSLLRTVHIGEHQRVSPRRALAVAPRTGRMR